MLTTVCRIKMKAKWLIDQVVEGLGYKEHLKNRVIELRYELERLEKEFDRLDDMGRPTHDIQQTIVELRSELEQAESIMALSGKDEVLAKQG